MIEAHPDALKFEGSVNSSYADVSITKQRRFESMADGRFFATVRIGDVFLDVHRNPAMSVRSAVYPGTSLLLRDQSSLLEKLVEKGELKRYQKAVVLFDLKAVGRFKVALDFLPVGHEEEIEVEIESRIEGDPVVVGDLLLVAPLTTERITDFKAGNPTATNFYNVKDADSLP